MAKIRAYKIAEELGLDKDEFLKKAAEIGIELKSHLVGIEDEQADTLRRRLGGRGRVEEKRVGSSVIRRRKKATPEAPAVLEDGAASAEESVELEALPTPLEGQPGVAAAAESSVADGAGPQEEPAIAAKAAPGAGEEPAAAEVAEGEGAEPAGRRAPPLPTPNERERQGRKLTRRKVLEGVALKEQDQLSRTMRGNVQQRLEQRRMIVEQQARMQPVRRRGVSRPAKKAAAPAAAPSPRKKELKLGGSITFAELAGLTGLKVRDLLRRARTLGVELERESLIDIETAQLLGVEAGFEVQRVEDHIEQAVVAAGQAHADDLEPRPPVVTVMGHVDHGKTTLLDTLRRTNVAGGEAGGITQHIGAYQVEIGGRPITFIDTPGHAAFTNMRARGAQITDIAVVVIAAEDSVMPQTVEAIDHARAAGVPIIIAINKVDKPDANPQRVKQALLAHQIVCEDFGGDVLCAEISAKKGTNIEKLLELIHLQAEILELKARRKGAARGSVIEAELDRGRGPLATVLVREGTLKRGDAVVAGSHYGRVRSLINDRGEEVKEAGPAIPVQIVGLSSVPDAGEEIVAVKNEREAKEIAEHRLDAERRARGEAAAGSATSELVAEDFFATLEGGEAAKELRLVVKADVRGTMEAICEAAGELGSEGVKLSVIHSGVGAITESDVMLASASAAIVVGFHVRPEPAARKTAEREEVTIRTFDVVYELLDDLKSLALGLLPPKLSEEVSGHAQVRQLFVIPRQGTVAGCVVAEGVVRRNQMIRVVRDGVPIYAGRVASLRRFKDDAREVQSPLECGIRVENFDDVKVGDMLESYRVVETRPTS